jgi:hypothetical protein
MAENNIYGEILLGILFGIAFFISSIPEAFAQELEPRTYTNTPVGTNFIGIALGLSEGNVLLDPTLPIEDLDGETKYSIIRYVRSIGLLGRSAKLKLLVPFTTGDWEGFLDGNFGERSSSGAGDARFEISWNIIGAPALSADQISSYKQKTIVGASIRVVVPTGEYDNEKLINLGSNRWSYRGEIGISRAFGKWNVELIGNVWIFGNNDDFYGGNRLSQEELYVIKTDLTYSFRPGFWHGVGIGYGNGGRTAVNGVSRSNRQENYRFGYHIAYPINKQHGVSFTMIRAKNHGAGGEFDTIAFGYQYAWGRL